MPRTGRPPAPTAVKMLYGVRASRITADEPMPGEAPPEPPEDRDEAWLAVWHRYVEQLSIMGMAYEADRDGIIAMVDSAVLYDRLSRVVLKAPAVVRDRDGMPTTPSLVKDMRAAATDLLRWLTAFGLTPSSRTQVRTRQVGPASRSPASDLLSVGDQQAYGRRR